MRVGSLFSGIGGIELGLERTGGFKTVWFVENDPYAVAVLKKRWPETPVYGDITQLDFTALPRIDMLTGGFPCQDISNAGKKAGISGSRSSLWKYYAEAIRILQPRIVLAENVSALVNRGLDVVLADLAALGYNAEWYCFPASAVGAPHQRDRIAILAYPNGSRCIYGQAPEQPDQGREYAQRDAREGSQDVADADNRGLEGTGSEEQKTGYALGKGRTIGWWATESGLGRVANGVPNRVDRIKCLGNAVVPAWAEAVGEAIINYEEKKEENDTL